MLVQRVLTLTLLLFFATPIPLIQECLTDEQTGTQTAVLNIRGLGTQRVTLSTFAIASKQTAAR